MRKSAEMLSKYAQIFGKSAEICEQLRKHAEICGTSAEICAHLQDKLRKYAKISENLRKSAASLSQSLAQICADLQ